MKTKTALRILASGNNERGTLFTRLVQDLFFSLGYDELQLDVQKSGREIDISGKHRLENRRIVGECKAHADKIGGDHINKFLGVLTREQKVSGSLPVVGYFISMSGFTSTALQQEKDSGSDVLTLIDGAKVIEELQYSNVLISLERATERAGHCARHNNITADVDAAEAIVYSTGYAWIIYYASGKHRSHFSLVHADGTPIAATVAKPIIAADKKAGGDLAKLKYLAPPPASSDIKQTLQSAMDKYRRWVEEEFGFIQLDGLPADSELSATRLRLERLFVPVRANILQQGDEHQAVRRRAPRNRDTSIGALLKKYRYIALLASPGGGKSTLVKRLATAYARAERRQEVADDLPPSSWLPVILRCRELKDRAHRPIIEILEDISKSVGLPPAEAQVFREYLHTCFSSGNALLLVDGLDEITDEGGRKTFAHHVRTFVAMFPKAALVVTSREAGFRVVAGVVASVCKQARLASLDEEQVLALCQRWHREVVGGSDKIQKESLEVGQVLWDNHGLRPLVQNPLLLTTLLVVKRNVGELPHSRASLYHEAIRVLVRTWNVEGYEPLDEGETLAQLSYVACTMMKEGKQQIDQPSLLTFLRRAREELQAELHFAKISPEQFIERIEYRSSLLMQVGYVNVNGILHPCFEFRHLTFQEYLTARGFVEEQYPGREKALPLEDLLSEHFNDDRWREVVSLAAVLGGRKAEKVVQQLTTLCESHEQIEHRTRRPSMFSTLAQCMTDAPQVTPSTIKAALRQAARGAEAEEDFGGFFTSLLKSRFRTMLEAVIKETFEPNNTTFVDYLSAMEAISRFDFLGDKLAEQKILKAFECGDRAKKISAAAVTMRIAFGDQDIGVSADFFAKMAQPMTNSISVTDIPLSVVISWAFAWIGENHGKATLGTTGLLQSLFALWRRIGCTEAARYPAWAITTQAFTERNSEEFDTDMACDEFLRTAIKQNTLADSFQLAALKIGWYRRSPWKDDELIEMLAMKIQPGDSGSRARHPRVDRVVQELLGNLGRKGRAILDRLDSR